MLRGEIVQYFIRELLGVVTCHRQVEVEVVTAAVRRSARDIGIVVADEGEHVLNEIVDVRGLQIAGKNQIEAGAASHGSEVDYLGFPLGVIADEGSAEMLNCVNFRGVHRGLEIGTAYADIKGSNDIAVNVVLPRHINTRQKTGMINFKAFNEFHNNLLTHAGIIPAALIYYNSGEE